MFLEQTFFDVRQTVEDTFNLVKEDIVRKSLGYSLEFAPKIPPIVFGDELRIRQVLLNLLNNAVKFTQSGNVTLRIYPGKRAEDKSKDYLVLIFAVTDSGIGMCAEDIQNLFSPFSQSDTSLTRRHGGAGLGLAICKRLVEMMEGNIWCQSHEDEGTTFLFSAKFGLPISEDKSDSQEEPKKTASQPDELQLPTAEQAVNIRRRKTDRDLPNEVEIPGHLLGMSILLTEDNKINQLVAAEMLKRKGFQIDIAENGREAVEKVCECQYGLILMDIQMPEMDGFQAVEAIRKQPQYAELPIIAMTAHVLPGYREKCIEKGMNDYITKPIDPEKLYETVVKWGKPSVF